MSHTDEMDSVGNIVNLSSKNKKERYEHEKPLYFYLIV